MSTIEIIPGMTEVMNYIKKQDEEIKKLKEEIERDSGCEENAKLRKENEKLNEKYGKLLKEYEELHEDCCSRMNKEQEAEVKKENEKLKEEIANLEDKIGRYDKSRDAWMVTADERHREITKLKKEIEELKDWILEAGYVLDKVGNIVKACRICKEQQRDCIKPAWNTEHGGDKCEFCHDNYDEENDAWTDNI